MDHPVSSLMSAPPITVRADDSVAAVEAVLQRHGLSFVPVLDGPFDSVVGIVSTSDLLHFRHARRDPATVKAVEICVDQPVTVAPDTPLSEVARQMVARRIHHVVVMENNVLKGLVSALDFVRRFMP